MAHEQSTWPVKPGRCQAHPWVGKPASSCNTTGSTWTNPGAAFVARAGSHLSTGETCGGVRQGPNAVLTLLPAGTSGMGYRSGGQAVMQHSGGRRPAYSHHWPGTRVPVFAQWPQPSPTSAAPTRINRLPVVAGSDGSARLPATPVNLAWRTSRRQCRRPGREPPAKRGDRWPAGMWALLIGRSSPLKQGSPGRRRRDLDAGLRWECSSLSIMSRCPANRSSWGGWLSARAVPGVTLWDECWAGVSEPAQCEVTGCSGSALARSG